MRLSGLCTHLGLAAFLLFSLSAFAQHGGGGGGGGSSGGGGGGSHGGFSGGSYSGGSSGSSGGSGHSSGGSGSHSSSGHNSSSGSGSGGHGSQANALHSIHGTNGAQAAPAKRTFFSFLVHPFRKPAPNPAKPIVDLRRPFCLRGPCPVCPAGQVQSGGGCGGTVIANRTNNYCSRQDFANGGGCLLHAPFLDNCSGLLMAAERQERSMQAARAAQQSACAAGAQQECSDSTRTAESEASLYRQLQNQYSQCRQRSLTAFPLNGSGFGFGGYASGLFDSLRLDAGSQ
jgi:hypothetical protein